MVRRLRISSHFKLGFFHAILLAAVLLAPAAEIAGAQSLPAQTPIPNATVGASLKDFWPELVKGLSWPVASVLIALLLYRPLTRFVTALGGRITKLSLFKVELELKPAEASQASTPLLDEIRSATTSAPIGDSSRMILEQAQIGDRADYAVIKLGKGSEWYTSRLFIAAIMMQRQRGVRVFVFVDDSGASSQRVVAVAPVSDVRWVLAKHSPWLEVAWARANLLALPGAYSVPAPPGAWVLPDALTWSFDTIASSDTGSFDPNTARSIVQHFLNSVQQNTAPPQQSASQWQRLEGDRYERASWVTSDMLLDLLPKVGRSAWTNDLRDAPRAKRSRAILRRRNCDFVAITGADREFIDLVNRRVLLEEMAASVSEEPESEIG
jgi:hypothetical protein